MVKPFVGKAKIKEISGGYKIEILASRNWFVIVFMTIWLCGWAFGWISAFGFLISSFGDVPVGVNLFILFWLVLWTSGGVHVIKTLVWMIFGKEIITIESGRLRIERDGDLLSKKKQYDLQIAKSFEVNAPPAFSYFNKSTHAGFFKHAKIGTLQFDYGLKTIRFGIGIDEAEGKFLLSKFKSKGLIAA